MKKGNLKKGNKWDSKIDKRIAELKAEAMKNGNHFIFILTSKDTEKGEAVSGIFNSSNFNVLRATDMFADGIPEEIMQRVMISRTLGRIGKQLSKLNKK